MNEDNIGVADTGSTGSDTNTNVGTEDWFGDLADVATPLEAQAQVDPFIQGEEETQEAPPEPEYQSQPEPEPINDVDAGRYQYWQSQADKIARERDLLMQQLAEYQQVKPVLEYLNTNPELVQYIEQHYRTRTGLDEQGLKIPEKPQKPANYNLMDLADPNSETSKYHKALEEYQLALTEYMVKKDEMREKAIIEQQQRAIQERQAYERKVQEYTAVAEHVMRKGFDEEMTKEFLHWVTDDRNVTLDNLVYAFLATKQGGINNINRQKAISSMRQEQARNVPPPVGIYGGTGNNEVDVDEVFGKTLLEISKKY